MVQKYMIPVYAFLIKADLRGIESLPIDYQIPVAEYMAGIVEEELNEAN
jgi:hypothetical protein